MKQKRAVRKSGVKPRSNLDAWPRDGCCPICSSRIELHAHQQTHRRQAIRSSSTAQLEYNTCLLYTSDAADE